MSIELLVPFLSGASYGLTTVAIGQPLDTIKTRMQGLPSAQKQNSVTVMMDLFRREGVRGLYRGGLPLFMGGAFMRSAQFGVSSSTKNWLEDGLGAPQYSLFGIFDWQVLVAGIAGGIGRGICEIPTDFFKTRRQVERGWKISQILDGASVTLVRNGVLFGAFAIYVDLSKQACRTGYVPSILTTEDGTGLTPFWKGSICANLAWITCWPADVIKTQRQSGNYSSQTSSWTFLKQNIQSGRLFRGVLPGLVRSTIANGSSMVVYEYVQTTVSRELGLERKDSIL